MQENSVVVIDSGFGGLTIFKAIREQMPNTSLIYCLDNKGFPYGDKSEKYIIKRVLSCLDQLCRHVSPSMIVIACNTASTVVLPLLRKRFGIPVVGVVPAIKPAAKYSRNRCIGLLATHGTINRSYTDKLIRQYANNCHVILNGSSELVKMAEDKLQGKSVCYDKLNNILLPFLQETIIPDYIVLGCTHFSWLKKELSSCFSHYAVSLIDSVEAVASHVKSRLSDSSLQQHKGYDKILSYNHSQTFCTKPIKLSSGFLHFFEDNQLNPPCVLDS